MSLVQEKADRVQRLLDDPDLTQAFLDVETALFDKFKQASVTDGETLHELKLMHNLLAGVRDNLMQAIRHGKLETYRLEEEKKVPFLGDLSKWKPKQ